MARRVVSVHRRDSIHRADSVCATLDVGSRARLYHLVRAVRRGLHRPMHRPRECALSWKWDGPTLRLGSPLPRSAARRLATHLRRRHSDHCDRQLHDGLWRARRRQLRSGRRVGMLHAADSQRPQSGPPHAHPGSRLGYGLRQAPLNCGEQSGPTMSSTSPAPIMSRSPAWRSPTTRTVSNSTRRAASLASGTLHPSARGPTLQKNVCFPLTIEKTVLYYRKLVITTLHHYIIINRFVFQL